jgi:uncharacterized protein with gpF-like domain
MTIKLKQFKTPKAVTDYFDDKGLKPAFSWLDVVGEEHAYNFTVAKAIETELLSTFQSSLSEANDTGQTLETWKKNLEPQLRKSGWWGPRLVNDPTGIDPARTVNFASPRRLRTIFHSNMRSARAAGQWQRIQRTKKALPYILYVRTSATEPRAEHLRFEGTILPADDAFWRTHFPPNGWGCKCSVRQLTAREAKRLGYDPEAGGPQVVMRKFVNRRTGEVMRVPEGIDPGWHTNPGLARARTLTKSFDQQLRSADVITAKRQIEAFWKSDERHIITHVPEDRVSVPAGVSPALADELGTDGSIVAVFTNTARAKFKNDETRAATYDRLPEIISKGEIVDEQQDGKRTVLFNDGKQWFKLVVVAPTGFLRIITFYQIWEKKAQKILEDYGSRKQ